MTDIALLKFAHVLGLVYWLGADLGVFYSSYVLCDERQPTSVRLSAARILFALDQAPRISMTLMLPLGVHLAVRLGYITAPDWVVPGTWAVALGWLAMVLLLHFRGHGGRLGWLTTMDFAFRTGVVVILLGLAGGALLDRVPGISDWAAIKLAIFAGLVLCGLLVRIKLRPFGPAFAVLAADRAGEAENEAIRRSIGGTRPFVVTIWIGLLLNTALGVHLL
jgi:hypothetical protein